MHYRVIEKLPLALLIAPTRWIKQAYFCVLKRILESGMIMLLHCGRYGMEMD